MRFTLKRMTDGRKFDYYINTKTRKEGEEHFGNILKEIDFECPKFLKNTRFHTQSCQKVLDKLYRFVRFLENEDELIVVQDRRDDSLFIRTSWL